MFRFIYIWSLIFRYAFQFLLIKIGISKRDKFKLIKNFFEDAGGSFIKFGQLLALRATVFPADFSLEILDLLDNYKPFPYDDVKEVFLQDLGAAPEKIFKDFQKKPFASASYGQVHAAKLADDTIVAVKILRPGIEEQVHIDFFIVNIIAFLGDSFFRMKALPWREFAGEFKKWTLEELDYHIEAANVEKMYQNMKGNPSIVIPKVYLNLSTRRILVEEYIEGIHLSRVLRGLKDGRLNRDSLLEMGVDMKKIPHTLVYEFLRQYFYFGLFHADLHPGNIILLPKNKIALIDFGIMGRPVPVNQKSFVLFMKSLGDYDFKNAVYAVTDIIGSDLRQMIQSAFPATVSEEQIDEFMKLVTTHFAEITERTARAAVPEMKAKKKDHAMLLLEILRMAQNYQIKVPKEMTIFIKVLSTLSVLCKEMDQEFLMQKVVQQFFEENSEDDFMLYQAAQPFRRITRERAVDQLHNWISYLMEVDPQAYQLVNNYIKQYNLLANG